jgi:hypothetical protein
MFKLVFQPVHQLLFWGDGTPELVLHHPWKTFGQYNTVEYLNYCVIKFRKLYNESRTELSLSFGLIQVQICDVTRAGERK